MTVTLTVTVIIIRAKVIVKVTWMIMRRQCDD